MPLWKRMLLTAYYHATRPVRAWNYWTEVSRDHLPLIGALLSSHCRRSGQSVDDLQRDVRSPDRMAARTLRHHLARRGPGAHPPRLQPAAVRQHHVRRRLRRQLPAGHSVADQEPHSVHVFRHAATTW